MKAIHTFFLSLLAVVLAAAVSSCSTELDEQSIVSGLRPLTIKTSIVEAQEVKGRAPIHTGKEFKAGDRIEFFGTNIYTADGKNVSEFHAVMQDNGKWKFSPEVMVGPEPAGISAYTLAGPNDVVDMIGVGFPAKTPYALYNESPEVNLGLKHTKAMVSFDIYQVDGSAGLLTSVLLVNIGEDRVAGSYNAILEKDVLETMQNISKKCIGVTINETDEIKLAETDALFAELFAAYYDLNWDWPLYIHWPEKPDGINAMTDLTGEPWRASFLNIPTILNGGNARAALQLVIDDKTYQVEIPATEWVGGKHYIYPVKVDLSQPADKVLTLSDATIEGWGEATDLPGVTIGGEQPSSSNTKTFEVGGVKFNMVKVEAGTFEMGKSADGNDETPVHTVTLTKDYYIGETEVTQALWKAVTGEYTKNGGYDDMEPAYLVTYEDVDLFITKLNALTNQDFRLPTEAEWEFAAKGGNLSRGYLYSGSNIIDDVAWYFHGDYNYLERGLVAQKKPNELGIYDMSGNVEEWCSDWYNGRLSELPATDPTGPSESTTHRVIRGGGYLTRDLGCSCVRRSANYPTSSGSDRGFRLALSPSK